MSLSEECEVLRGIPMFSRVDAARLKLICFTSERTIFRPGVVFLREGEIAREAFVMLSGGAEVLIQSPAGDIIVAELSGHQLIGEVALLHGGRRSTSMRAKAQLECLRLSREVFFHLLREIPDFALEVMREVAERLDSRTQQLRHTLATGAVRTEYIHVA